MHYLPMNLKTDYPVIVRAEGRYLYADDGRAFLDGASGGVGAVNIGHAVPEVLEQSPVKVPGYVTPMRPCS